MNIITKALAVLLAAFSSPTIADITLTQSQSYRNVEGRYGLAVWTVIIRTDRMVPISAMNEEIEQAIRYAGLCTVLWSYGGEEYQQRFENNFRAYLGEQLVEGATVVRATIDRLSQPKRVLI